MSYTVKTTKGVYRYTHEQLVSIAEELIIQREKQSDVDKLFNIVCAYYGVAKYQVLGTSRKQQFVNARRVLCYMLTEHAGYSLKATGRILHLDHSTVSYHVEYMKEGIEIYDDLKRVIEHAIIEYKMSSDDKE